MSESQGADFEQRIKTWHTFTRLVVAVAAVAVIVWAGFALAFVGPAGAGSATPFDPVSK